MIKKIVSFIFVSFVVYLSYYLSVPTPGFVPDPPKTLQSNEPADTESIYRRSYFTNLSREEITKYYSENYKPNLKLNHPPEFGGTFIRDQTRSSWLEEFIHLGKDSLYINGFYPTKPTEQININGVHYAAKITVRYVPSSLVTRYTVMGLIVIGTIWLLKEYELI